MTLQLNGRVYFYYHVVLNSLFGMVLFALVLALTRLHSILTNKCKRSCVGRCYRLLMYNYLHKLMFIYAVVIELSSMPFLSFNISISVASSNASLKIAQSLKCFV